MEIELIKEHNDECEFAKTRIREKGFIGDWNNEPNRLNWTHAGLDCMIIRNPRLLHWCGYVGLRPNHSCFKKRGDDVNVEVHGGLTYARDCEGHICHITDDPSEKIFWLGFDCAHYGDLSPGFSDLSSRLPASRYGLFETYRNLAYIVAETNSLAEQLEKVSTG